MLRHWSWRVPVTSVVRTSRERAHAHTHTHTHTHAHTHTHTLFLTKCFLELPLLPRHADPADMDMYKTLGQGGEGGMPRYLCLRGTSQLEGYHRQLNGSLAGHNNSPKLAGRIIGIANFRCELGVA